MSPDPIPARRAPRRHHLLAAQPRESGSAIAKGAGLCARQLPRWDDLGGHDFYYWMYASKAIQRLSGPVWTRWTQSIRKAALEGQRGAVDMASGSWDPHCVWGPDGGRVYSTALLLVCLETVSGRHRAERAVRNLAIG